MSSVEDLKKALKNRPKFDLEWVPEVQEWFEDVERKFSVFKADYDLQVHVPRKQLEDLDKGFPSINSRKYYENGTVDYIKWATDVIRWRGYVFMHKKTAKWFLKWMGQQK